MSSKPKKSIVIGAGIAGLATAIRLAAKGHKVVVFETNSYAGGKLSELTLKGYRFDAGPSLFTMPELVTELFTLANKNPNDYFQYIQLGEVCYYFFADGTELTAFADKDKFATEAAKKTGVSKEKVERHLKKSAFIYESTAYLFLERSLHKIESYLSFRVLWSMLKLPFLNIFVSMHQANAKALNNQKMTQLFDRYATYNGSNPYKAPGILNIIPHLEFGKGAFLPKGGMISITNSLYKLAVELGVEFHFNAKVERIIVENGKATAVVVGENTIVADNIISNMDVFYTYQKLLKDQNQPNKILNQERSTSALIFYWGIKHSFPKLLLHNIFFSDNYEQEFQFLAEKKAVYHDPTVYVNITSKHEPQDAPSGCENWFVMINVPSNNGQNWDSIIAEARKNILFKLSKSLNTDIESLIEAEDILDPRLIDSKTSSYQGALYGTSSNNKMAAFFRHPNFTSKIKNLYFCGGSVHPGGGIPLALSSAKIIDRIIV